MTDKIYMTPHFSMEEFQCKCGACRAVMPTRLCASYRLLAEQLEVIRGACQRVMTMEGKLAFYGLNINSGYRCAKHPRYKRGSRHSVASTQQGDAQIVGVAADMQIQGLPGGQFAGIVDLLMADGLILRGGVGTYAGSDMVHYDTYDPYTARVRRWHVMSGAQK